MTKPYIYIPSMSLLLFYLLMYFQLDYKLVFITEAAIMIVLFAVLFLLGWSFFRDKKAEAEEILKDAKSDAEKIMNEAELNIKQKKAELINYKAMLNAEKEDLLKKEAELNNKAEKWKQQLSQQSLKLNYYGNFISWLWRLTLDKNTDDTSKIDSLKRKLHGLRR